MKIFISVEMSANERDRLQAINSWRPWHRFWTFLSKEIKRFFYESFFRRLFSCSEVICKISEISILFASGCAILKFLSFVEFKMQIFRNLKIQKFRFSKRGFRLYSIIIIIIRPSDVSSHTHIHKHRGKLFSISTHWRHWKKNSISKYIFFFNYCFIKKNLYIF